MEYFGVNRVICFNFQLILFLPVVYKSSKKIDNIY